MKIGPIEVKEAVSLARQLERVNAKRRNMRKQLKALDVEYKAIKRSLKAMEEAAADGGNHLAFIQATDDAMGKCLHFNDDGTQCQVSIHGTGMHYCEEHFKRNMDAIINPGASS